MGPDNGLVAVWHQTITWTNGHLLAIGPLVANYSEIAMKTLNIFFQENGFENVVCKMLAILFIIKGNFSTSRYHESKESIHKLNSSYRDDELGVILISLVWSW